MAMAAYDELSSSICRAIERHMLSDWELWACANHYVNEHGEDAAVIAAMRCDELLDACDYEGARNYQAIIMRINRLLDVPSGALN